MSLASHEALPPLFSVHPELRLTPRGNKTIDPTKLGGLTFYGCEVETQTHYDGEPTAICEETGWLPAKDGSINGAEWKSPLILSEDPIPQKITEIIDTSKYDARCGGHIHAVRGNWNGLAVEDAWDVLVENWVWLFAILYPERIRNSYSRIGNLAADSSGVKLTKGYRTNYHVRKEKFNWLGLKDKTRMEFRIFPAVQSTKRLRNRMKLLDVLLAHFHKAQTPEEAYTLAMDEIVPALRSVGGMKNFPRKSMLEQARMNAQNYVFWPSNLKGATEPLTPRVVTSRNDPVFGELFFGGCNCSSCDEWRQRIAKRDGFTFKPKTKATPLGEFPTSDQT